jgi:hypothetical protein
VIASDLVFADGFDSGSLSAWSAAVTDGGNLGVSPLQASAGGYGMSALVDDVNPIFVTDESPTALATYRARFWFDPNTIAMAKRAAHVIFAARDNSGAAAAQLELRWNGAGYDLRADITTDASRTKSSTWIPLADAPHMIELNWRAATSASTPDGSLTLLLDGAQRAALTGVDNDTRRVERASLGAVSGIDSGTRGTEYFDSFESRR